jgi:hypothetical protein
MGKMRFTGFIAGALKNGDQLLALVGNFYQV